MRNISDLLISPFLFQGKGWGWVLLSMSFVFISCSGCNSSPTPNKDADITDHDSITEPVEESPDYDGDIFPDSDSDAVNDGDSELPDIDMHCPLPYQANYPYYREDGSIHFCRPCDTPDEYDPQCVKSLWKDLNKEVYDKYKNGEFEDNEWIKECYPWPCEWNQIPTTSEEMPHSVMECDIRINPYSWASSFRSSHKEAHMDRGQILFHVTNYRIGDVGQFTSLPPTSGYQGQRAVLYDIKTGKYQVITGIATLPAYMNDMSLMNVYSTFLSQEGKRISHNWIIHVVPYKNSFKYSVAYSGEESLSRLSESPYFTNKWTIMVVRDFGKDDAPSSLMYAKTDEWRWTTLAHGAPYGEGGELSISGDNALVYHVGTNATWLCDLLKSPQKITDCKKVGREGEIAGYPEFDRDNSNRVIYRSIKEGEAANKYVIMDISQEPWKIEKEFDIPKTETSSLVPILQQLRSNVLLYKERYVLDASGYQEDQKLCFYRLDTGKSYCSKLIGDRTEYNQGFASFEGKYLFWQPSYAQGYILRDMECYCEKAGVCPYEGMSEFPSIGVGN